MKGGNKRQQKNLRVSRR